jgi:branched-chain amino acid transport system ATP-binding protein
VSAPILEVSNLQVGYGAIRALRGVSFAVSPGETVAIVGANGAGKTTLMKALSGMLPIAGGEATLRVPAGEFRLGAVGSHQLARAGLLHVPEGRGTLRQMSVEENLLLAWEIRPSPQSFEEAVHKVFERFPRLNERRAQLAGNLSGGEQQMLSLARAIINPPHILLVDEPSLGLSPLLTKEVFQVLAEFRDAGVTTLIVEQNVRGALALAHRAYVLAQGVFVAEGEAKSLANDPAIVAGYLGHGAASAAVASGPVPSPPHR